MVDLDQDHAALRFKYDATKPIHQITVLASGGGGTNRVYVYEITEILLAAPANYAKTVALNHVATLVYGDPPYMLTANTKYYVVAVSDGGLLAHERLFEAVALAPPNIATFSDPSGITGAGTNIIITVEGTMGV